MKIYIIWFILAAILIIGEIFTAGFFLFWFGIGAAVAGVLSLFNLGLGWQWGAFIVVSGVLFAISRRFAEKVTAKQPPGIGADRFIGKKGVVLERVDNIKNTGRVRIDKDEWRADSETDLVIAVGKMVMVKRLDGTHLVVEEIKEGES